MTILFSHDQDKFINVLDAIDWALKISIIASTDAPEPGRRLLMVMKEVMRFGVPTINAMLSTLQARFEIVHKQFNLASNGTAVYGRTLHSSRIELRNRDGLYER